MNYKYSRDMAWQTLIKNNISVLPVKVKKICKGERISLWSYRKGAKLIRRLGLENNIIGNDAFSFERFIFYDDTKPPSRQRFSIAHEIGHILMHDSDGSANTEANEREADIFASRLLAPLCVLHFLGVGSSEEISELCQISMIAARIRYDRLFEIRERDREMRRTTGHGCFLLSPLERQVHRNFRKYIEKNKTDD